MINEEVKKMMKEKGLFQWQVAEMLGISEWQFSRYLRHELTSNKKSAVIEAIKKIEVKQ